MQKTIKDLKDLGQKPNWVSTSAESSEHRMEAWPMAGSVEATKKKIIATVAQSRGSKLVEESGNTLHFEFTTMILRFVDDVWFVVDEASKRVHFSSQSRVGYSDLGANRKRMDQLAKIYLSR